MLIDLARILAATSVVALVVLAIAGDDKDRRFLRATVAIGLLIVVVGGAVAYLIWVPWLPAESHLVVIGPAR